MAALDLHGLLLMLVMAAPLLSPCSSASVSFDFASFSFLNLTLLGDAFLRIGTIGLTKDTAVPSTSAGAAICTLPIPFRILSSFATKFSFFVSNPDAAGDGLTFFLSPSNATLGAAGAYMGLFTPSPEANNLLNGSVIAVEFDARLDAGFGDPSANHVGLDLDAPVSVAAVDLSPHGIDLKSGRVITTWIEYQQNATLLKVWLGYSAVKPQDPILITSIDLSKHFADRMFAGFSASTEGSTEAYTIQDWSFSASGPSINRTQTVRQNASASSWSVVSIGNAHNGGPQKSLSLGLAVVAPTAAGVVFALLVWASVRKWMQMKADDKEEFNSEYLTGPRKFSYKELNAATKGFHSSKILGNGAFGTVYKAVLLPGSGATTAAAVKRSKQAHESKTEFLAELSIIARLRHKNLVQLQGWCVEKKELLLVYEFMPNGSLDKLLHRAHESGGPISTLKWPQRYNAAAGIASVLTYLHQECEQQVIHRDIKTSNILLDANFNPRLGDFGLARLMDHNKSPVSTLTAGTMGYLAPEYLQYGKATDKTDVFSYGVVLLEICCGRRPIDAKDYSSSAKEQNKLVNLVDWVWKLYSEDKLMEAADKKLKGEFEEKEMLRLLLVGLSCANPNSAQRPTMRRVLQILNCEAEPVAVPKTKPLLMFASTASFNMQDIVSELEGGSAAVVTVSIQG